MKEWELKYKQEALVNSVKNQLNQETLSEWVIGNSRLRTRAVRVGKLNTLKGQGRKEVEVIGEFY